MKNVWSSSKHIAIVGMKGMPTEFAGTSGVEFYAENKALSLIKHGKKIDCYVRSWATPKTLKEYKGIRLIHIPTINTKHFDAFFHSLFSTLHSLLTISDTVWYHASGPALFCWIPKMFGKKIIVTIHTLEWKRDKWGPVARFVLKLGEWIGSKTADVLVAASEDLQQYLQEKYKRVCILDLPDIKPFQKINPEIITNKYGLRGNDYILYLGRFVPEKRIEWIIRAYQEIQPKGIKLVLAGGSSHTDQYVKKLYNLSTNPEQRTPNQVIFTGYIFGKEKQELLTNCKLFVLPSSVEGSPVVLREILARTPRLVYSESNYTGFKSQLLKALKQ